MVDFDIPKKTLLPFLACGLMSGLVIAAPGCDPGDLAEQCGLVCPADGIVEGNASISGIVSVDSFFGAVISVRDAAANVSAGVRAELEGMAASLEIEGYADMSLEDLAGEVALGIQGKLDTYVDGGLTISYQEPRCEANVEVAVEAAAECDVEADPGAIEASCEGSCEVSADVAAECSAMGTLECTGQAPSFMCDTPTCKGDCQLEVAAGCEGTCNGTCNGSCTACTGGTCEMDGMGNITNCAGSCDAECTGTCELEAAGMCSGRCEGECTYNPGMGVECEAGATAKCDVSAMAEASCEGSCEGEVRPPEVSAECEASVEAEANASVECTPPSLNVEFAFAAGVTADQQAEFKAWLVGFKGRFAAMAAAIAKLERVQLAAEGLITASGGAVADVFAEIESGDLDLKASIGIGCAIGELDAVGAALGDATGSIQGSISAFGTVSTTVGGG